MFTVKIVFARLLYRVSVALAIAQSRLSRIESKTYLKQGAIRREAERKALAARAAQTELAQQALARLVATQQADERAITAAAWKN